MNSTTELATGRASFALPEAWRSSRTAFVLPPYVALCLLSVLPFILVEHPPIVDFANHTARLFMACNAADPTIAQMYDYRLGIIPNLTVDALNLPLCGVVAPATVLRLVTVASLLLIYASGWLIQRKLFGRPTALLFLMPAMSLNIVTTMGYTNYLSGVAVAIFLIALAIDRDRDFKALLPICNLGGLVLFFCHIFSLALALVFFFGLMLRHTPRTAKGVAEAGLRTAALFALPLLLVVLVPGDGQALTVGYFGKIRMVVALFMTQHSGIGIFNLLILLPLYLLFRHRLLEIHPSFRTPLLVLAAYVVVVPSAIQDAMDVDTRTFIALAYLFLAGVRPVRAEPAVTAGIAAVAAGFAAFQVWAMLGIWQPFSDEVVEFRQSTDVLPRGATVLSLMDYEGRGSARPLAYAHLASYATIDRKIFNPLEFTGIGMQPLSATSEYLAVDTPASLPFALKAARKLKQPTPKVERDARKRNSEFALRWPERFDYVIYYHFGAPRDFAPASLVEIRRGSFFSIFKVRRPQQLR